MPSGAVAKALFSTKSSKCNSYISEDCQFALLTKQDINQISCSQHYPLGMFFSYSKNAIGVKKASPPKGHFAHIGNEIKICSQNKCHHRLSNVCENSFRMFHSNWVISDYHSFVWQFVRFSQGNSNCQTNEW